MNKLGKRSEIFEPSNREMRKKSLHAIDGTLLELLKQTDDEKCGKSVKETKETYRQVQRDHCAKLINFSNQMSEFNERRNIKIAEKEEFENKRVNFGQFITDNMAKIRRQYMVVKENKRLQELGRNELKEISQAIELTTKRREELQKKLNKLRVYETFVTNTLKLLPQNYIRSKTNAPDSLISRYEVLHKMNEIMFDELYEKQETAQKENEQLLSARLKWTENLLTKCSELQLLGIEERHGEELLQHFIESYERDKEKCVEECVRFFTVIRGLRNIAEKAANGLNSIQRHPLPNQHKVTLSTNFRIILKFLDTVSAIRDEIEPPVTRKTR